MMRSVNFAGHTAPLPKTAPLAGAVHFGSASTQTAAVASQATVQTSSATRFFAELADKLFNAPDKIDASVKKFVEGHANGSAVDKLMATVVKNVGGFAKMLATFDYHEFPEVALGKLKFLVSEPPIGAMILLLYPFTVGPRLFRAYERGKKNGNDFREVGDVLRRDMTAITIFLFMLKPLLRVMNKVMQRVAGIELVDLQKNAVHTFSGMKNYALDNADAVQQLLREGNGKGLLNAVKTLRDRAGSTPAEEAIQKEIAQIKELVPQLLKAHQNHQADTVKELSERLIGHINAGEAIHKQSLEAAKATGDKAIIQAAEKLQGEFREVVSRYGKSRLLPVAVLGFAIVIGAIGWFPVWFNAFWNKSTFEKEQAAKRAADLSSYNPQLTMQALRSSSRLGTSFRQFQA